MVEASRTLMKSEPELAELIATVEGVEVTMAEKGFGTRVQVRADEGTGLEQSDLEALLWTASRSRSAARSSENFQWKRQQRPAPGGPFVFHSP